MKIRMGISLFLVLAVVFASPTPAQTIHSLLIIDDGNPSTGSQLEAARWKMRRLLRYIKIEAGIPFELSELRSNVDEDDPEWMSEENILKWTQVVNADRDDVVFVYFSGHGGAHRTTRELYLSLPSDGKFDRKVLADAVDRIPCRLKILLTDTDSYGVPILDGGSSTRSSYFPFTFLDESWPVLSIPFQKVYANLFLEHAGFLNVAAATEGEYSIVTTEGGIFTRAFVVAMLQPDKFYDDGFVSWAGIFKATKEKTHFYFKMLLRSPSMPQWLRETLTEVGLQSQRPKYFGKLPQRITREE